MSFWVKCADESNPDQHYFWDPSSNATAWSLPTGARRVPWVVQPSPSGLYYWHEQTREVTDQVPWEQQRRSSPAAATPWSTPLQQRRNAGLEWPGWQFYIWFTGDQVPDVRSFDHEQSDATQASSSSSKPPRSFTEEEVENAWVEVSLGDRTYYWNFRSNISCRALPAGSAPSWSGLRTTEGSWYYSDLATGDTAWSLPGADGLGSEEEELLHSVAGWMLDNTALVVQGLVDDSKYNNQVGQLIGFQHGRLLLKLSDPLGGPVLALHPRNVRPLEKSTLVELQGLSHADLNGQVGTVTDVEETRCRYEVKLSDGSSKSVPGNKVLARSRLWYLDLEATYEQGCLFIDSKGEHKKYSLQLPRDFSAASSGRRRCAWPVLVYLHGNGGGPFFCSTSKKKARNAVGMQHAANKFVVVSPDCDWTWKQQPRPWVNELVAELRAAHWVDHKRVYLTGSSMGGMGTWELGAMRPDLYAAIAPVAAYHKAERREMLAAALCHTPVFPVHSSADGTCPLTLEEPLWQRLAQEGNDLLQVSVSQAHDHTNMFERAYCDTTMLFDWLLMFRQNG